AYCTPRLLHFSLHDALPIWHPAEHDADLARETARVGMPLVVARVGRHGRQACGLWRIERRRGDAEIAPRRGLASEHAVAPLDDVEIELEDAAFVENRLEHDGKNRLLALAPVASLAGEEEI